MDRFLDKLQHSVRCVEEAAAQCEKIWSIVISILHSSQDSFKCSIKKSTSDIKDKLAKPPNKKLSEHTSRDTSRDTCTTETVIYNKMLVAMKKF